MIFFGEGEVALWNFLVFSSLVRLNLMYLEGNVALIEFPVRPDSRSELAKLVEVR